MKDFLKRISGKLVWQTPHFELELTQGQEAELKRKGVKMPTEGNSVAIGHEAVAAENAVAIGAGAQAGPNSVSIGHRAVAGRDSVVIGANAGGRRRG